MAAKEGRHSSSTVDVLPRVAVDPASELLIPVPPDLGIHLSSGGDPVSRAELVLTNPCRAERVAFKIKSTCAETMAASPKAGFLRPGETVTVKVALVRTGSGFLFLNDIIFSSSLQHLEAKLRQEPVSGVRKRSRDAFVVQSAFARAAPIELSDAGELWRRYVRQGDAMEHRVRIRFDDGLGGRDKESGRRESTPQPMIPCIRGGGERERRGGVGEAARGLLRATVARDSSASSSSSSSDGNRRHSRQKPEDKPTSVRTVAPSRPPAASTASTAVASKKVQVPSSSSPARRSPVQRRVEGGGSARGMLQQGQSKRTGGARTITEEEGEEEEIIPVSCRSWTRRSSNRTKVTFQKPPTPGEEDKAKDEIKAGDRHLLRNEEKEEETMADLRSEVEQLKRMLSRSLAEKEQSKVESLSLTPT